MSRRPIILVYHAISVDREFPSPAATNVTPPDFREQLDYLRNRFQILPLDRNISGEYRGGKDTVSITFDDGYRDTYRRAYRLLKELEIPATFFLTVSRIGRDWPFPRGSYPGLSWDEVGEMAANPLVEIGSHGLAHRDLTKLPENEA